MPLHIEMTIEPTEMVFQRDAICEFKVTNRGKQTVTLSRPSPTSIMPVVRIVGLQTGQEEVFRRELSIFRREFVQELKPGESLSGHFDLSERIEFPAPGDYEVVLEYDWNEASATARSEPVRLKLTPSSPRYLTRVSAAGGISNTHYLLWINSAAEKPQAMMARMTLLEEPKLYDIHVLQVMAGSERPVLSIAPNRRAASHQWVAWLEGGKLQGFRLKEAETDGQVIRSPQLPDVPTFIIPPLLPAAATGPDEAATVILCQTADTGQSNIQLGVIEADGNLAGGPAAPIHGGRPVWGEGVCLSTGMNRIYAVASETAGEQKTSTLQCIAWPAGAGEMQQAGRHEVEGQWLSAAVALDGEDMLRGALLTQTKLGAGLAVIKLHRWSHGPDGQMELAEPLAISWPEHEGIRDARLGIDLQGIVYGLVQSDSGSWSYFTSQDPSSKPVASPAGDASGQVEILILGGLAPAILFTQPQTGFHFSRLDGGSFRAAAHP